MLLLLRVRRFVLEPDVLSESEELEPDSEEEEKFETERRLRFCSKDGGVTTGFVVLTAFANGDLDLRRVERCLEIAPEESSGELFR